MDWFHEILRRESTEFGYRRLDLDWSPFFKAKVSITEAVSPAYPIGWLHWEGIEKVKSKSMIAKLAI